jgi:hypothetical protein
MAHHGTASPQWRPGLTTAAELIGWGQIFAIVSKLQGLWFGCSYCGGQQAQLWRKMPSFPPAQYYLRCVVCHRAVPVSPQAAKDMVAGVAPGDVMRLLLGSQRKPRAGRAA